MFEADLRRRLSERSDLLHWYSMFRMNKVRLKTYRHFLRNIIGN